MPTCTMKMRKAESESNVALMFDVIDPLLKDDIGFGNEEDAGDASLRREAASKTGEDPSKTFDIDDKQIFSSIASELSAIPPGKTIQLSITLKLMGLATLDRKDIVGFRQELDNNSQIREWHLTFPMTKMDSPTVGSPEKKGTVLEDLIALKEFGVEIELRNQLLKRLQGRLPKYDDPREALVKYHLKTNTLGIHWDSTEVRYFGQACDEVGAYLAMSRQAGLDCFLKLWSEQTKRRKPEDVQAKFVYEPPGGYGFWLLSTESASDLEHLKKLNVKVPALIKAQDNGDIFLICLNTRGEKAILELDAGLFEGLNFKEGGYVFVGNMRDNQIKREIDHKIYQSSDISTLEDLRCMSVSDVIATLRTVYDGNDGRYIPFNELILTDDGQTQLDKAFIKNLMDFLSQNKHVKYLEIRNLTAGSKGVFDFFLEQLVECEITTVIVIRDSGIFESKDAKKNTVNVINTNIRNHRNSSNVSTAGQNRVEDHGILEDIPTAWYATVRPKYNRQRSKLGTQYEQSVTTTKQGMRASRGIENQRLQNIILQQQRQQQQKSFLSDPVEWYGDLVDQDKFLALSSQAIPTRIRMKGNVRDFARTIWDQITGRYTATITRMTKDAALKILAYPETFQGGLLFHNLPEGFYIQKNTLPSGTEETVLGFDVEHPSVVETNPLTLTLNGLNVDIITPGSVEQFELKAGGTNLSPKDLKKIYKNFLGNESFYTDTHGRDVTGRAPAVRASIKRQNLYLLINALYPEMSERLENDYGHIINSFNNGNLFALRGLLIHHGAKAFVQMLSKLNQLHALGVYDSFQKAFMNPMGNLEHLADASVHKAIDDLCSMNANQIAWWNALSNEFAKVNAPAYFVECVNAFKYFNKTLEELNLSPDPIILPSECSLKDVSNIQVALDRLLYILQNAADVKEQLCNLEGVSMDPEAAYFAIREDNFNFVCGEMRLVPEEPTLGEIFTYQVSQALLTQEAAEIYSEEGLRSLDDNCKILLCDTYRYIGCQRYIMPFEQYRKIIQLVDACNSETLYPQHKASIKALLAIATTGERSYQFDQVEHAHQLLDQFQLCPDVDRLLSLLLRICQNVKPTLPEMSALICLFTNPANSTVNLDSLTCLVDRYDLWMVQALANLGRQKRDSGVLSLDAFLKVAGELYAYYERNEADTSLEFVGKYLVALSTLNIREGEEEAVVETFDRYIANTMLRNMVEVLLDVNVTRSSGLPGTELFSKVDEFQARGFTLFDIKRYIQQTYKGVSFESEENSYYSQDCTDELIAFLKEINNDPLVQWSFNRSSTQNLDDVITEVSERRYTVEDLVERYQTDLPALLMGFDGQQLCDFMVGRFSKFCKSHLVNLVAGIQINDPRVRSEFTRSLLDYLGTGRSQDELNDYFARYKVLSKFLQSFVRSKGTDLTDFLQEVSHDLQTKTTTGEKTNVLCFLTDLLSIEVMNIKQKRTLYLLDKSKSEPQDLLRLFTEFNKEWGSQLFQYALDLAFKNIAQAALVIQCIDVPLKLLGKCNETLETKHSQQELADLASPLIDRFAGTHLAHLHEILIAITPSSEALSSGKGEKGRDLPPAKFVALFKLLTCLISKDADMDAGELKDKLIMVIRKAFEDDSHFAQSLQDFAGLYAHEPSPSIDQLVKGLGEDDTLEDIAHKAEENAPYNTGRDVDEQLAFDEANNSRISKGIVDLLKVSNLGQAAAKQLTDYLKEAKRNARTLAQCYNWELSGKVQQLRARFAAEPMDESVHVEALACLCEIYYRTTKNSVGEYIYPNDMQLLAVLNSFSHGPYVISGIDTGEGKSVICALQAAMLWLQGDTVDLCSSDRELVKRDFEGSQDFYHFLGVGTCLIKQDTTPGDYRAGGVNFSTPSDLSLYRAHCEVSDKAHTLKAQSKGRKSLILDEGDHTILDDSSQSVLSENTTGSGDRNEYGWVYDHINNFVDYLDGDLPDDAGDPGSVASALDKLFEGKNRPFTIATEVIALRNYLHSKAADDGEKALLIRRGIFKRLNTWIRSAKQARALKEGVDFVVDQYVPPTEKDAASGDSAERSEVYYQAVITENGFRKEGSTWSDGVQQLLHARLTKTDTRNRKFVIRPERKPISSTNTKNFIGFYRKKARRILANTGSPGSYEEVREMYTRYGFRAYQVPPYRPNQRKPLPLVCAKNLRGQVQGFARQIRRAKGAPVLINCSDINTVNAIYEQLKSLKDFWLTRWWYGLKHYDFQTISADNEAEYQTVIQRAKEDNKITISTITNRGTDITDSHDEGLLVLNADLTSVRGDVQRNGRTARRGRPGKAGTVLNGESVHEKYGVDLRKATSLRGLRKMILRLQKRMGKTSELERMQTQRFNDIADIIQRQFAKWHRFFLDTDGLENNAQEVLDLQREALEDLKYEWDEILAQFDHQISDKTLSFYPKQRLNHALSHFIPKAIEIWREKKDALEALASGSQTTVELPGLLTGFQLSDRLTKFGVRVEVQTAVKAGRPGADSRQSDGLCDTYVNRLKKQSQITGSQLNSLLNQLEVSKAHADSFDLIMEYQEAHKKEVVGDAARMLRNAIGEYGNKGGWIASDRKRLLKKLVTDVKRYSTSADDVLTIIELVNGTIRQSLVDDITISIKRPFMHRAGQSDFREKLFKAKAWMIAACPPSQVETMLVNEVAFLASYLPQESLRGFYSNKTELKAKIEGIATMLKDADKNNPEKLRSALSLLDNLKKHPDYSKERCALTGISKSLKLMLNRHARLKGIGSAQDQQIYVSLRKALKQISLPRPKQRYHFFGDCQYVLPTDHPFKDHLAKCDNAAQRYYLYHMLSQIHDHLARRFNAFDITFKSSGGANDHIGLTFKLADDDTYEVRQCDMKFHYDMQGVRTNKPPAMTIEQAETKLELGVRH